MVEFIDDNHIVVGRIHLFPELLAIEGLDGHEEMLGMAGTVLPHCQFAKVRILHDLTETVAALFQDFFAVRNEKELRPLFAPRRKAAIVKSGNCRLPCACGSHHQIMPAIFGQSFRAERIQNGRLVGVRLDVKAVVHVISPLGLSILRIQRTAQLLLVPRCIESLEILGVPIGFKSGPHLLYNVWHVLLGDFHVPFHAVSDGRPRQIGRTHIGSRITAFPIEHIGLRMQPRFLHIIGNPHRGVRELRQSQDGFRFRSAHVCGRRHAELSTALCEFPKRRQQKQ